HGRRAKAITLDAEPSSLLATQRSAADALRPKLEKVFAIVHWPGQPGYVPPPPPKPLSPIQQSRFETGRMIYAATCVQCHKPNGLGQAGLAPLCANLNA